MDMVDAKAVSEEARETQPQRLSVLFTPEELKGLAEFFNDDDGVLSDELYTPIAKKLLIYAAKYGLYDEEL